LPILGILSVCRLPTHTFVDDAESP
jgi:hypothetical protein